MEKSVDFVKWFSELNKDSKSVAGGKGANLAEVFNLGISVPAGFVVTAQAYDYFIEEEKLKDKIEELLARIDYEDTKQLDEMTKQIRVFIMDSKFPKEMEDEILEAYSHLDVGTLDQKTRSALSILKNSSEPVFVAVRSSATAEDLADASFAGQQDSFVNVKGNIQLLEHVKKCFASLFTSRATYYRNKKGFEHSKVSIAVVVQKMVDSDKSGVIFSKDPSYKNDDVIMEAVWGLGEGIVSGKITPDKYIISSEGEILEKKISEKKLAITRNAGGGKEVVKLNKDRANQQVLKNYEIEKLAEIALKLEDHYQKPQDIEFAIEGEEIFIVQTRPITTMESRVDMSDVKIIKGDAILSGLAASPGIGVGKVRIVEEMYDLQKIRKGDVLVTEMTNPDMVVTMQKCAAIVTDEGGLTAHAAIVSREMGIPAIVGTGSATTDLKDGEIITVDGFSGNVYRGKTAEGTKQEVNPVKIKTKTNLKVIVDLPSFAERAAKTKLNKVGLTRMEGIIAESGKHPNYFLKQNKLEEYEEVIFKGVKKISNYFDEIWVRTSDIRSDEYENLEGAPSEKEANPMLGMHGIRYGLKNLGILKSELKALKRVSSDIKRIGILMPQVISVDELKGVKKILKEIEFEDVKVGIMIETPAAVQLIRDFCEEGIDFISFGTNDLTQYMLAIDRGNSDVQHLYDEMHPSILYQLSYVIRVCKRYNVETSICGQAGSKPEMVKFLVEKGIDSITANADAAEKVSEVIADAEYSKIEGTDKEPRQYQPSSLGENVVDIIEENIEKGEEIIEEVVHKIEDTLRGEVFEKEGNGEDVIEENSSSESVLEKIETKVNNEIEEKHFAPEGVPRDISKEVSTGDNNLDEENEEEVIEDIKEEDKEDVIEEIEEDNKEDDVIEVEKKPEDNLNNDDGLPSIGGAVEVEENKEFSDEELGIY